MKSLAIDAQAEGFRVDSQKSFAVFTIQPIRRKSGLVYNVEDELHIEPRFRTYAGHWGLTTVKTLEDVATHRAWFDQEMAEWQKSGLVKIMISEKPVKVIQMQLSFQEGR